MIAHRLSTIRDADPIPGDGQGQHRRTGIVADELLLAAQGAYGELNTAVQRITEAAVEPIGEASQHTQAGPGHPSRPLGFQG